MVSLVQLLQQIYDELKVVVSNETSVSSPDNHVGVLNRAREIQTPFFGFEWQQVPAERGIGGNNQVETVTLNSNDDVDGVVTGRDYDLIVDFGIVVEDDGIRERDGYLQGVESQFNSYVKTPENFHQDVQRIRDDGAIPANLGKATDVGVRKTFVFRYKATKEESLPPAETVDWDVDLNIDAGDEDVYPERY